MTTSRHGCTRLDVAAIVVCGAAAGSLAFACLASGSQLGPRENGAQMREAQQVRTIGLSLIMWASQDADRFPLPSRVDRENHTVAEVGRAKDTTANIYSLLVWNGTVPVGILVSPTERNDAIRPHDDYVISDPPAAVNPAKALWDPSLNADFTGGRPAHVSFPHLQPAGERLERRWRNTFSADHAIVSTRGPRIDRVEQTPDGLVPTIDTDSITLSFYATGPLWTRGGAWSGNVAFNDNHTEFLSRAMRLDRDHTGVLPMPAESFGSSTYPRGDQRVPDLIFYDEHDMPGNAYLGIFTRAGEAVADYRAIWD